MANQDNKSVTEWRSIISLPNYEVSEFGAVRRALPGKNTVVGKVLKGQIDKDGYRRYCLYRDGKKFYRSAHRLVAEAFIGPRPFPTAEVAHWDGTRTNNHWSNLRYTTPLGNGRDKVRHGNSLVGIEHPGAKLTDDEVKEIRAKYAAGGTSTTKLARNYGLKSAQSIGNIINRLTWSHLP